MDVTPEALMALAAAASLHAIPKIVEAWKMRTNAVSQLILDTAAEVKRLRAHVESGDRRTAALIDALRESNERIHALEQEQGGLRDALEVWRKRARQMAADMRELYRAVTSGHHGVSVPPPPPKEPWEE